MEKGIELAKQLNDKFTKTSPETILEFIGNNFGGRAVFSSSLGIEDQAIFHMIAKLAPTIKVFTLDTGRLFPETYELLEKTRDTYQKAIEIYFPDYAQVEEMVNSKGVNLFYKSIENRKLCCHVRKIAPLQRALKGAEIWVTGIRKDQSLTRFYNQYAEWDESNRIVKVNPLLDWSEKQVWEYIHSNNIPYNTLHDQGYPSIGCQPCTRAVQAGEDIRSGRWWWEQPEQKECGLHNKK